MYLTLINTALQIVLVGLEDVGAAPGRCEVIYPRGFQPVNNDTGK